ncbi:Uncharacterised protein [Serratia proteamaculans]|uniref:hypothetical protein n=1 Tax=Serratia proteamaculans TaxID=28151 RepID=UPI00124A4E01|nr:hypothetical protein [Serratia proteamaculans]KAB1494823.1 hypothetical protein F8R23_18060 [Serratia proteamaculans]CAI1110321.1 Uncharacterised protein [Serratia proteamaculans]CAI1138444.1 Uncharacterised protein [Serratia proteamaculans]
MENKKRNQSGAGSHAGRGFRYQDAVGVWLALRCWRQDLPYGLVIPEGRDDYELHGITASSLVQVKSRRDHMGSFPISEVVGFVRALWNRYEAYPDPDKDLNLILERSVTQGLKTDYVLTEHPGLVDALRVDPRWKLLSSRTYIWIVAGPAEQAIEIISDTLPCVPVAAQVYYGELLNHIGGLADSNGMVKNGRHEGLAISDVEAIFRRMEPVLDVAGMEMALREGYCDSVDFLTIVDEPAFYLGMDTRPAHLAAGLVVERPEARSAVLAILATQRAALIVGQSGTGKSALMWETARISRHTVRWFEITRGDSFDAHLLIRFARSLRAASSAPVGFIFDDVGKGKAGLWDGLLREARAGSGILLLGSIREEDVFMLTTRSLAGEVRPTAEEAVAERIWQQLSHQGQTTWAGWREPWAQSNGLLLEYTHILTRGERLEIVLEEQIDCRLREARDTELAILRITALAGAAGAMVDIGRLSEVLDLPQSNLSRALRRLIDEHLISESLNGQLGGLHQLRSATILRLCHKYPPPTLLHTITETVFVVHHANLDILAVYVLIHYPEAKDALIKAIATRIEHECEPATLVAALSGLGQAHIEMTLRDWLPEVRALGLEPTQVTGVVMFAVADADLSSDIFPKRIKDSIRLLQTRSTDDPRLALFSQLSLVAVKQIISASAVPNLRGLLGAILGIDIPANIQQIIADIRPCFDGLDLMLIADLLSAVRLIDPDIAMAWASSNTPERLIARIPFEIPWAGKVSVEAAPEGRLLRSSIFHIAHSVQTDIHKDVVQLCTILIGLDPTAVVAAVDAVAAGGFLSGIPDYPVATKRISRENLPPSALPEWNKRWITTAAGLVGTESYTDYLQRALVLLNKLVPLVEKILDGILRSKAPSSKLLEQLGAVHEATRELTPPKGGELIGINTELHATPVQNILFCCSADMILRFISLPEGYAPYIAWLKDLLKDIERGKDYPWDLVGGYPEKSFMRLKELITSLCLLSAEAGTQGIKPTLLWLTEVKSALRGGALSSAVRVVMRQFNKLMSGYLLEIEGRLKNLGIETELHARPDWEQLLPWPTSEVLAIVELEYPEDWLLWLEENGTHVQSAIGEHRRLWIIPRIAGIVVSRLTVSATFSLFASPYAVDDWLDELDLYRLNDKLVQAAQPALSLITELDGLRHFNLGTESRPHLEQSVRQEDEKALMTALLEFEQVAEGTPVRMLLRQLNEECIAGRMDIAKGGVALLHGQLTAGGEALLDLQFTLLTQDLVIASAQA